MKLYAFQPGGHGEASFFTIAENENEARECVDKYVQENYVNNGELTYMARGWGTDYYIMTVIEQGQVIENDND